MWDGNRVGIGLLNRPGRLHRLAESIPWNRFVGSLKKVYKYRLRFVNPSSSLSTLRASISKLLSSPGMENMLEKHTCVVVTILARVQSFFSFSPTGLIIKAVQLFFSARFAWTLNCIFCRFQVNYRTNVLTIKIPKQLFFEQDIVTLHTGNKTSFTSIS